MRNRIRRFFNHTVGSLTPVFAISAVALIVVGGMAIDYTRGSQAQTKLQSAADSAVLAAAQAKVLDNNLTANQLTTIARDYFDKNRGVQSNIAIGSFALNENNGQFDLAISANMTNSLLKVAGFSQMAVNVLSVVEVGANKLTEVALVLDNTGSMSGAKLSSLKSAANDLVDNLLTVTNPDTRIALVPFAQYVNIGTDKQSELWLSVAASSGGGDDDDDDSGESTWNGCVGSRNYPENTTDSNYTLFKIPGVLSVNCPAAMTPLTNVKTSIKSAINGMSASGTTYIPAGLAWGWRLLSPEKPFNQGKPYGNLNGDTKALVLMSDGANTVSPTYPKHQSYDIAVSNQLTAELCTNIKASNIVIYTIAFEVSNTAIKNLLEQCATDSNYYFDAGNSSELVAAFGKISSELTALRLVK